MTVDQIFRDIDEHGLSCSFARVAVHGSQGKVWSGRIGELRNMRLAATFEAAVIAAWAAYTNAEAK